MSSSSTESKMNLAALQRVDSYITRIITSASQVAVYKFSQQEWEKTDTEGTMFVYERNCDPKYGFLILNRRSKQNLVEPVTKELDFQLQTPFLLYKTKEGNIYGIWFYEAAECERVSETVHRLVRETEEKLKKRNYSAAVTGGAENNADLASLLGKAKSKENKGNSPRPPKPDPAMPPASDEADKLMRLLTKASGQQAENQPQPPSSPPNLTSQINGNKRVEAPSEGNVAAFFAKAASEQNQHQQQQQNQHQQLQQTQSAFSPTRQPQPPPPPQQVNAAANPPPPPMGPIPIPIPHLAMMPPGLPPPPMLLPANLMQHMMQQQQHQMMAAAKVATDAAALAAATQSHEMTPQKSAPLPGQSNATPLARLLSQPGTMSLESLERQHRQESVSPQPPQMPASARCVEDVEHELQISEVSSAKKTGGSYAAAAGIKPLPAALEAAKKKEPNLISPAQLAKAAPEELQSVLDRKVNGNSSRKNMASPTQKIEPLTVTQMTQALNHLIKTDKEFVAKLHRAYVDSLNDKLQ